MEKTLYSCESNNCCAYCKRHRVGMTAKQIKGRNCLQKQCHHLEKYEDHGFWKQRECTKKKRIARKMRLDAIASKNTAQY